MAKSNDWIQIQYKPGEIFLPELQFETVARLIYLATFADENMCIPISNLHNYLCNLSFINEIGEKSSPILFGNGVFKRGAIFMNPYLCRRALYWKATPADESDIAITKEETT